VALVSFDVFDDRRRRRVAGILRPHGDWFQQSLWIVERSSRLTIDRLVADLDGELAGSDRVVAHRPCASCAPMLWWRPTHRSPTAPPGSLVT
jgi:hypothetical protein